MSDEEQDNQFFYDDHVDYDHLITGSMHWLIKTVLLEVENKGFPGEHHLYISFDTTDPSVDIPDSLRKRFPEEMTIVLQNRYYDMAVDEKGFSVSLSFSRVLERLTVPYSALTRFYDPSCGFVLQLSSWEESEQSSEEFEHIFDPDQVLVESKEGETASQSDDNTDEENADKVVSLDHFRKK